jgi:Protein of unknown function (DUF3043)
VTADRSGRRGRAPRDTQRWARAAPGSPAPASTSGPASRRPKAFPDESLHPRDRGPVRAYVRDIVDSRRHGLVGLFVPGFGGTLIAALGPASNLQRWLLVICAALLAVALVDAFVLGRTATRRARARFPGEVVDGWRTGFYAFMRAHRMRNLRLPPPRVERGDSVP